MRKSLTAIGLLTVLIIPFQWPQPTLGIAPPGAPSDFNGDGYADLAIGAEGEDIGDLLNAGGVNVLYGSAKGLTEAGDQLWSLSSPGIPGVSARRSSFGSELTTCDFDGDGYADLAAASSDAITVLYGTSTGLSASEAERRTVIELGLDASGWWTEGFRALSSGDFNGDARCDLVAAIPGSSHADRPAIVIVNGTLDGLAQGIALSYNPLTPGLAPDPTELDTLGWTLATGDANGDGFADVAAGAPRGTVGGSGSAGAVHIAYGSESGLDLSTSQIWAQDRPGMQGEAEDWDQFGAALSMGDFDGDGYADLAVGAPGEAVHDPCEACAGGAVSVIYGGPGGLTADGHQIWHQDVAGVPSTVEESPEDGDQFGETLASGDLNGDGTDDLAVGAPREDVGRTIDAGAVVTLLGSSAGLTAAGSRIWTQNSTGISGTAELGDRLGSTLLIANYGRSAAEDLAIGVPYESIGRIRSAGVVDVIYGRSTGPDGTNAQGWSQDSLGIHGTAETGDDFGEALGR